jgi:DNA-directed RNA polymerase specialized sigma24 family protein
MKTTIKEEKVIFTKKELRSMLVTRLNSLHSDVNSRNEKAERYLTELKKTRNDKRKALMDLYAAEKAPVKVTDYSGLPKKECDMTGEMLDFSQGFDEYIASLEKEYMELKRRRNEAIKLLTMLMTLKPPYSMILYLRYYRKISPKDACYQLHIARSTLFRKQSAALTQLSELFAEHNGIIIKSDK